MSHPLTADAAALICNHMNDDHLDAVVGYARAFGGITDAVSARMLGLDATGMDLEVALPETITRVRIAFDHTLVDADDARQTLIRMARSS
jgi:putative heme iron utilization protein